MNIGHCVNEKNKKGRTPMFCVVARNKDFDSVIYALLESGANIYQRNNSEENIVHFVLNNYSWNSTSLTKFVEYTYKRKYHQMWRMRDSNGTHAYKLLSRELGQTHPLVKTVLSELSSIPPPGLFSFRWERTGMNEKPDETCS